MKKLVLPLLATVALVSACNKQDKTRDNFINSHPVSELQAGIWVDPNGCQHWMIDDGVEGYLSARLTANGLPVCNADLPIDMITGKYSIPLDSIDTEYNTGQPANATQVDIIEDGQVVDEFIVDGAPTIIE